MSLEDFQLELLFATPVLVGRLGDSERINAALEAAILERRKSHPGIERSNVGGWHSAPDLLHWGGDPLREVAAQIVELADANTHDMMAGPGQRRGWVLEAWANVSERGGANQLHAHPGCFWSAVYYVRVDPGGGGELILHDPRVPAMHMHAPMLRFRHAGAEAMVHTTPQAGMLVLFPSWLNHSVAPYLGDGLRISIALNLSAPPSIPEAPLKQPA
ncbi:MAG TPA: TIGR02466 family protein [Allosphingosinicella sp.]|nr:TIGR02466 family protein [Allosphingosinicella sp.]